MDGCPDELRLDAYHDGELSPAGRDALAAHLVGCDPCGAYMDGLRRVSAWMTAAAGAAAGLSPIGRARLDRRLAGVMGDGGLVRFGWELSGAAAAVLVAGSAWLMWSAQQPAAPAAGAVPPWVDARTVAVADPAAMASVTPAAAWYGVESPDGP